MLKALRVNAAIWLSDLWSAVSLQRVAQQRESAYRLSLINRQLMQENATLTQMLVRTEADRRAMRDSVVEHMKYEEPLRNEIASLRRHLNMAIEERDRARAERKNKR